MNELLTVVTVSIGIIAAVITIGGIINPRDLNPEKVKQNRNGLSRTLNYEMICPYCQRKGQVRVKTIIQYKRINVVQATAAILTFGITLLATGFLRKEQERHAHCGYCNSVWHY
ncbi:MAG: hypothetical protein P8X73_00780 [Ignavibacteriaceae bacterium]